MQGIGLSDTIIVKKCAENGTKYNLPHCTIAGLVVYLCTNEKTIPTDLNNLALKGIAVLLDKAKDKTDLLDSFKADTDALLVEIEKRLPVAAGIAGGSGNGAAAVLGLNALMGYPFSLRDLMRMGAEVGADVPFSIFMNAYRNRAELSGLPGIEEAADAAWISGIGDEVEAAEPLARYVIMANPGTGVSTAEAYKAIDEIGYDDTNPAGTRELFINDLERYTLASHPEAAHLKQIMEQLLMADEILMSGSGPTIAAYYKDKDSAKADANMMKMMTAADSKMSIWLTSTGITQEEAFQI